MTALSNPHRQIPFYALAKIVTFGLSLLFVMSTPALSQDSYQFPLQYREGMRYSVTSQANANTSTTLSKGDTSNTTASQEEWTQSYKMTVLTLRDKVPSVLDLTVIQETRTTDGKEWKPDYLGYTIPLLRNSYGRCSLDRKRLEDDEAYSDEEYAALYNLELGQLSNLFDILEVRDDIYLPRQRKHPNQLIPIPLGIGDTWDIDRDMFVRHTGLRNGDHFKVEVRSIKAKGTLLSVEDNIATLQVEASFTGKHELFDDCEVQVSTTVTVRYDLTHSFFQGSATNTEYSFNGHAGETKVVGKGTLQSTTTITLEDKD